MDIKTDRIIVASGGKLGAGIKFEYRYGAGIGH
jgi:hypothetical protein